MPSSPRKSLTKEDSVDLFQAFNDGIDWSQISETQLDSQFDTQQQIQSQTQTTLVGNPSVVKLAHSPAPPPARTISVESGGSTRTNDSIRTLVVDDEDVDYQALLEGAENIDWDDWDTDEDNNIITTPRKLKSPSLSKKFTPVNLRGIGGSGSGLTITPPPPYTKPCTRCIVVDVTKYHYLDEPVVVSSFSFFPGAPSRQSGLYCNSADGSKILSEVSVQDFSPPRIILHTVLPLLRNYN